MPANRSVEQFEIAAAKRAASSEVSTPHRFPPTLSSTRKWIVEITSGQPGPQRRSLLPLLLPNPTCQTYGKIDAIDPTWPVMLSDSNPSNDRRRACVLR